jgi:thiosulfate/3-mercaptopyruvate sulfurtransferase
MRTVYPFALAIIPLLAACDGLPTGTGEAGASHFESAAFGMAVLPQPDVATRPSLLMSADWLAHNSRRPNVVVLHVGTPGSYAAGHIPGARFIPLSALQGTHGGVPIMLHPAATLRSVMEVAGISTSDHVVVYGDGALQAARGFFILDYLGHPRVSLLDGGLAAWRSGGYEVATGAPAAAGAGRMGPPVRSERLVGAAWVLANAGGPGVVLIDARPAADFAIARIPGASSLPWTLLVESTALPRLRPAPDLRALFASTGVDVRSTVATYCVSGMMSSMAYFAARYLGYDVRLYDGSWLQWTALGMPIES